MHSRANHERRSVRYTFLLTPDEFQLAHQVAASKFRTLPDFLRSQIHETAATLRDAFQPKVTTTNEYHDEQSAD